jgi:hypothetical protein
MYYDNCPICRALKECIDENGITVVITPTPAEQLEAISKLAEAISKQLRLPGRRTADTLFECCTLGFMPDSIPCCVDYELTGPEARERFAAYKRAVRAGVTADQFHATLLADRLADLRDAAMADDTDAMIDATK